ncbi:MAG: (Fe-S)-binding protein [Chitinophagales bacterium]
MELVQIIVFILVFALTLFLFFKEAKFIYRNIKLGRPKQIDDNKSERFKRMLLIAFGQKKMFKNLIPAFLHLAIYVAFLITQIELIEILIDGFTGKHRLFFNLVEGSAIGEGIYIGIITTIEALSILAFIATIAFLARRNLLKVPRLTMSEMNGWPKLDANIILFVELYLIICIFLMNGADMAREKALTGEDYGFPISGALMPLFANFSPDTLKILERIGWWGHILGVFAFLVYIPHSKHLHIMLAFPNVYFSRLFEKGRLNNMEAVTNEVKLMMDPNADPYAEPEASEGGEEEVPEKFGAKDVQDLNWKHLLDAYSCTECGRCSAACPASQTGKKLSPRKIMMDTRDRLEEVGKGIDEHGPDFTDNKSLLGDYITTEELRACTTCNACVEECPVSINPLDIIFELRRHLIMEDSNSPEEWNLMFNNIENNGAPWQFSPTDRLKWADELEKGKA